MTKDNCEVYKLGSVTLNLDDDCNMVVESNGIEVGNTGHDWEAGYKLFAKSANDTGVACWDIERFWGWKELGAGLGTPKDQGYTGK